MSNIAIIPARGGSKRIPHKNIKPFLGKPVIAYSIDAALKSGLFDEIMVSTDDWEIADIAVRFGATVPFMRSTETSNDYATTSDVIKEVISQYAANGQSFSTACCIYSTAPFITAKILNSAYKQFVSECFDSIFPVVPFSYPVMRGLKFSGKTINMVWPEYHNARSQDLEPIYHDAGQFYFFNVEAFLKQGKIWGKNTGAIILSELQVQDLDTETDWELAEMKYKLLH